MTVIQSHVTDPQDTQEAVHHPGNSSISVCPVVCRITTGRREPSSAYLIVLGGVPMRVSLLACYNKPTPHIAAEPSCTRDPHTPLNTSILNGCCTGDLAPAAPSMQHHPAGCAGGGAHLRKSSASAHVACATRGKVHLHKEKQHQATAQQFLCPSSKATLPAALVQQM